MEIHILTPTPKEPEHEHADVIRTTARQVWSAEAAIDSALRENALLVVSVLENHRAVGLAPCAVHKALEQVASTQTALFQSRTSLLGAHAELRAVQDRMGAGSVRLGGLNKNEHDDVQDDSGWSWPFGFMSNVVVHPASAA